MKRAMKKYVVQSTNEGVEVLVSHSEHPDDTTKLDQYPGGFEWGYDGAGPRSLAHAILSHCIADTYADIFMREVVAVADPLPPNTPPANRQGKVVVFTEEQVLTWLRNELNKGVDRLLSRRSSID